MLIWHRRTPLSITFQGEDDGNIAFAPFLPEQARIPPKRGRIARLRRFLPPLPPPRGQSPKGGVEPPKPENPQRKGKKGDSFPRPVGPGKGPKRRETPRNRLQSLEKTCIGSPWSHIPSLSPFHILHTYIQDHTAHTGATHTCLRRTHAPEDTDTALPKPHHGFLRRSERLVGLGEVRFLSFVLAGGSRLAVVDGGAPGDPPVCPAIGPESCGDPPVGPAGTSDFTSSAEGRRR